MLLNKLKLSKPLVRSMTAAGFLSPTGVQLKTMSRIIGGQDLIVVAPEGSGKTTAYVLGVLMRLKYGFEEAPRALILVPDKERLAEVVARFELINRNQTIRVAGLYPDGNIDVQMDTLADGADIVIATPDRARAIYLKLGLNLNKILMFIVDDAAEIIKRGQQLPVAELARSIVKCQHLVFTELVHDKLHKLIDQFMNFPALVEVSESVERQLPACEQVIYHVPDFRTKLDLLYLLMKDREVFDKVAVFVNTRLTAEKVFKDLVRYMDQEISVYRSLFYDQGFDHIEDFKRSAETRILIIADDLDEKIVPEGIPVILHLEIPADQETYLERVISPGTDRNSLAISFSTDIELSTVKKIERSMGTAMRVAELPAELRPAKK